MNFIYKNQVSNGTRIWVLQKFQSLNWCKYLEIKKVHCKLRVFGSKKLKILWNPLSFNYSTKLWKRMNPTFSVCSFLKKTTQEITPVTFAMKLKEVDARERILKLSDLIKLQNIVGIAFWIRLADPWFQW